MFHRLPLPQRMQPIHQLKVMKSPLISENALLWEFNPYIDLSLVAYLPVISTIKGCGIAPAGIVGGSEATPYSLPWQVALVSRGGSRPFCGGTLISPTHVLTAAHCTSNSNFDIIVGEHSITDSSDGTRHQICRAVRHPNYNSPTSLNNDFSIVHLRQPVSIGGRAVPACLPDSSLAGDALAGRALTVSGWGTRSSGGSQPNVLHQVSVPAITNAQCSQAYSQYSITEAMICAGNLANGGVDSCQGDSGGLQIF